MARMLAATTVAAEVTVVKLDGATKATKEGVQQLKWCEDMWVSIHLVGKLLRQSKKPLPQQRVTELKRGLRGWQSCINRLETAGVEIQRILAMPYDKQLQELYKLTNAKAPSTIYQRALAIRQFLDWADTYWPEAMAIPFAMEPVCQHLYSLIEEETDPSTGTAFLMARHWTQHHFSIPVADCLYKNGRLEGLQATLRENLAMRKQAPILPECLIASVVGQLLDESEDLSWRLCCGHLLLVSYSRGRCTDATQADLELLCTIEPGSREASHLHATSCAANTRNTVARRRMMIPIVADGLGCSRPWGAECVRLRKLDAELYGATTFLIPGENRNLFATAPALLCLLRKAAQEAGFDEPTVQGLTPTP